MFSAAVKRTILGTAAALMLSVGTLGAFSAHAAEADTAVQQLNVDRKIKIFRDTDGTILAVCYYTDSGVWLGCDLVK